MKKIKTRRKHYQRTILILIISILTTSILIINYISKKIYPIFLKYAEIETKKISNTVINNAISKTITNKNTSEEIFTIKYDKNDEIKTLDFNTPKINEYLTKATKSIQEDIKNIEKGNINKIDKNLLQKYNKENLKKGIIYTLNAGIVADSPLLANLGPKIPIRINLIGDIISYISADVEDYGINNSMVKVFINLEMTEQIIVPFYEKNINMKAKVPIAIKLVTGKLPQYYLGTNQSKQITVPN